MYGKKLIEDAEGEALRKVLDDALNELGVDKGELTPVNQA